MTKLDHKPLLESLLEDISSSIRKRLKARSIVVFGSVARGEERQRSDVDIIVVSESFPESYSARFDTLAPAFQEVRSKESYANLRKRGYHLSFSAVPYRPEDLTDTPPLLLDVAEDGVILYDDGLMRKKVIEVKERLRELGSKRVRTQNGRWYWVLKPDFKPGEVIEI